MPTDVEKYVIISRIEVDVAVCHSMKKEARAIWANDQDLPLGSQLKLFFELQLTSRRMITAARVLSREKHRQYPIRLQYYEGTIIKAIA